MRTLASGAPQTGLHTGSIPWLLITGALVLFVVYRAWRGARRQVAGAIADAYSEARARAEADAKAEAQAKASQSVLVQVGSDNRGAVAADELVALLAQRLASLDPGERSRLQLELLRQVGAGDAQVA